MASVSSQGNIFTWSTTNRQRWAAFAPGFEELETNVLYSENEDEFDIVSCFCFLEIILLYLSSTSMSIMKHNKLNKLKL